MRRKASRNAIEIAACTMAKREREEEFEVSEVAHPSSCASVKRVVKTLSPMKKSKSCSYSRLVMGRQA